MPTERMSMIHVENEFVLSLPTEGKYHVMRVIHEELNDYGQALINGERLHRVGFRPIRGAKPNSNHPVVSYGESFTVIDSDGKMRQASIHSTRDGLPAYNTRLV